MTRGVALNFSNEDLDPDRRKLEYIQAVYWDLRMRVSPSRAAAFDILLRVERQDSYASELLHAARVAKLSSADHALLTELVMGVLRWRSVLDNTIGQHIVQSIAKLDLEVLTALRLGAYQLMFLDRVPAHAAINESVELVKAVKKRSAAGLLNAVLRKIQKNAPAPSDFHPRDAHPVWLVKDWETRYGPGTASRICEHDQTTPRPTVRIHDSAVRDQLKREGIALHPGELVTRAFHTHGDISKTNAYRERRLIIQDEASQLVALLLGKGGSILDCCAAPGGKTRVLAERNPESQIVAVEFHPHRAALMRQLVSDENVRVVSADARRMPFTKKFDRILVDAPCSGTGTLARNPEIKWRLKKDDLPRLQKYQLEILTAAIDQLAPGGRLVYSTCSLEPEENETVIKTLVEQDHSLRVIDSRIQLRQLLDSGEMAWQDLDSLLSGPFLRTIPGVHPCDGFFAAMLERD